MTPAFRCSVASAEVAEPLAGTASTVRSFLLVEAPGPWGTDALRDSRLPDEVKQHLVALQRFHALRPLLIRAHGGGRRDTTRVFVAATGGAKPWLETTELDDVRDLLDLDLSGVRAGRSPGLTPYSDPLFLACTHGRHDACCAELGRPLCAALSKAAPEQTWEISHIGGDRFAGNMLVLPHGLYYGRVAPESAAGLVQAHRDGLLDLEHLRGRSSYPFALQAAEVFLRRLTGDRRLAPLTVESHTREDADSRVVFAVDGERWEVRVHAHQEEPRLLTCRAANPRRGLTHSLAGINPVEERADVPTPLPDGPGVP